MTSLHTSNVGLKAN